ncbi:MAG: AtpZ/AtpI family protein [Alphaproteobacteria bacterium]
MQDDSDSSVPSSLPSALPSVLPKSDRAQVGRGRNDPGDTNFDANLDKRLERARRGQSDTAADGDPKSERESSDGRRSPSGLGVAARVLTEFAAAIGVAVVIGVVLDRWLGTTPWALLIFVFLGFGAAILNLVRLSHSLEAQAQESRDA